MKHILSLLLILVGLPARAVQPVVIELADSMDRASYYTSVEVPDGNYLVTVTFGSKQRPAVTTVRAESRRLFIENEKTAKGQRRQMQFVVNKRTPIINSRERVRIKERERTKLNWDNLLTFEVTGPSQAVERITVERDTTATTVFLCGNSTVVDQDYEPWASWGQMITRWFGPQVCFANFAESGETASTFLAIGRYAKALSMMKRGDIVVMEFGHNDQKQKMPGAGPYYNFATALKTFVDEARRRGATPIFVTPTQRRFFDAEGKIKETHGEYPEAMQWVAQREKCPLIDLHQLTRRLFEHFGPEGSKQLFVHYPAHTYAGQDQPLADNTHFNPYGAYEIAKLVIEGMKEIGLPIVSALRPEYKPFSPEAPDARETFLWTDAKAVEILKPDGN